MARGPWKQPSRILAILSEPGRQRGRGQTAPWSRIAGAFALGLLSAGSAAIARAEQSGPSPAGACEQVRLGISRLAEAERKQADVLQLAGHGGDLAPVAKELQEVLGQSAQLRDTLTSLSHSASARDSDAAHCLALGYQTLFEAQKLTTEVERVLFGAGDQGAAKAL